MTKAEAAEWREMNTLRGRKRHFKTLEEKMLAEGIRNTEDI